MHKFMRVDAQSEVPSADRWLGASESEGEPANNTGYVRNGINCNCVVHPWVAYVIIGLVILTAAFCFVGWFVLFGYACRAAANSNTDEVRGACGKDLWVMVVVQICVSALALGWLLLTMCMIWCRCSSSERSRAQQTGCSVAFNFLLWVGWIIMTVYMLIFASNAEKNADCVSALKKNSGGLDSPLLIYVGYA